MVKSYFNLPEGKGLSSPYEEPPILHPWSPIIFSLQPVYIQHIKVNYLWNTFMKIARDSYLQMPIIAKWLLPVTGNQTTNCTYHKILLTYRQIPLHVSTWIIVVLTLLNIYRHTIHILHTAMLSSNLHVIS